MFWSPRTGFVELALNNRDVTVNDLNDRGIVVGYSSASLGGPTRGFVWDSRTGFLQGFDTSFVPYKINNLGLLAGYRSIGGNGYPYVYDNGRM